MKWECTIWGTPPKGINIPTKVKRYKRGGGDNNANEDERNEKAEDLPKEQEKLLTQPNYAWQYLGFHQQNSRGNIEVVFLL